MNWHHIISTKVNKLKNVSFLDTKCKLHNTFIKYALKDSVILIIKH